MSFIQQMSSGYDSPLEIKGQALIINAILLLDSVRRNRVSFGSPKSQSKPNSNIRRSLQAQRLAKFACVYVRVCAHAGAHGYLDS